MYSSICKGAIYTTRQIIWFHMESVICGTVCLCFIYQYSKMPAILLHGSV